MPFFVENKLFIINAVLVAGLILATVLLQGRVPEEVLATPVTIEQVGFSSTASGTTTASLATSTIPATRASAIAKPKASIPRIQVDEESQDD
jgi:hypothetical protein